jgi:hypothetical protein
MRKVNITKIYLWLAILLFCSNAHAFRTVCDIFSDTLKQNEVVVSSTTNLQECAGPYGTGSGTLYTLEYINSVPANTLGEKRVCIGYNLPNGYTVITRSFSNVCLGQQFEHLVLNAAPVPNLITFATPKNTALTAVANATDANNDPLTYFLGGNSGSPILSGKSQLNGNILVNKLTGEFTYSPANNIEAQDFFTVYVTDGKSDAYGMSVFITVGNPLPGNQPPQFIPQSIIAQKDFQISFTPEATDTENNPLTFSINTSKPPLHGTLTQTINPLGTLILTYKPTKGFTGVDNVHVKVSDGYNTALGVYPITVAFVDKDSDGMPGWWEMNNQLNYIDPADALSDADGDKLNNLGEFIAGTSLLSADTDSDGLPDGYEVSHGNFDPLVADSQLDFDGDGYTNYEEYLANTNPNIFSDNPRLPLAAWLIPILFASM